MNTNKGLFNAMAEHPEFIIIMHGGGMYLGDLKSIEAKQDMFNGNTVITLLSPYTNMLDTKGVASEVATEILRKLLEKAKNYKDKKSEDLITGALVFLDL